MGAMAIASATAAAFVNPDNTAIAFVDYSNDGKITDTELAAVKELISTSKAAVFNDLPALEAYIAERCK